MKKILSTLALAALFCGSAFAQSPDIYNTTTITVLQSPAILGTYSNTTGINLGGYVGQPAAILMSTNTAGTNPTMAVQLQNSTTATGTYANFGPAYASITTNGVLSLPIDTTSLQGSNYFRAYFIIGGTTPTNVSTVIVVGRLKYN